MQLATCPAKLLTCSARIPILVFTMRLTPPDPLANLVQLLSDRLHVSLPPLEPFVGEL